MYLCYLNCLMMENYVPGCNNGRLVVLTMLPVMMLYFFAVVPLAQHFHVSRRWRAYKTAFAQKMVRFFLKNKMNKQCEGINRDDHRNVHGQKHTGIGSAK